MSVHVWLEGSLVGLSLLALAWPAVVLGGTGGSGDEIARLITKLAGPDGEANGAAMQLSRMGKPALGPLVEAVGKPAPASRWAAWALGMLGDKEAVPALLGALGHPDAETRGYAIQALAELKDARAVPPLVAYAGAAPAQPKRSEAVLALGRIADPAALPHLRGWLKDGDKYVRVEAAKALGAMKDATAADTLRALSSSDPSVNVRNAAAKALKAMGL